MQKPSRYRYLLLSTAAGVMLSSTAFAFDPNADANSPAPAASPVVTGQPDDTIVYKNSPRPLYAPGTPIAVINPDSQVNSTDVHGVPNYIAPVSGIVMPHQPLYPSHASSTQVATSDGAPISPPPINAYPQQDMAPTAMPPAPAVTYYAPPVVPTAESAPIIAAAPNDNFPPVSPEVKAKAQAIMAQQAPTIVPANANEPVSTGFIAPAPLITTPQPAAIAVAPMAPVIIQPTTVAQAPVVMKPVMPAPPAPVVVAVTAPAAAIVPVAPAPSSKLSEQTRAILSQLPSHMDTPKPAKGKTNVTLARVTPEIHDLLGKAPKEESFDSLGLSIKVRHPGLDANYELGKAYTALMGGDTDTAIQTYKDILSDDPENQDALFGLAATYHRLGDVAKAQPLYGKLLKLNPNHREGLNNFLALVAQESPQDALPELLRLQQRNPDFSPITAQVAIVMDKMGYPDQAREQIMHAIELSPDNLTYRYNLAVMLDRQGHYAEAGALYQQLIKAGLNGETLPTPLEAMQKRLNYITAAANGDRPPG